MKKIIFFFGLLLSFQNASAEEVYNFYFQKAQGPGTVVQGDAGPASATKNEVPPQKLEGQTKTSLPSTESQRSSLENWTISIGYAVASNPFRYESEGEAFGSLPSHGPAIGASYDFSPYFGVDASLQYLFGTQFPLSSGRDNYLGGTLGVNTTPLRIKIFDADIIDIGLGLGFIVGRTIILSPTAADASTAVSMYLGPRLGINFTEKLGLLAEMKLSADRTSRSSGNLSVRYRF